MSNHLNFLWFICFIVVCAPIHSSRADGSGVKVGALYCEKVKGGYNLIISSASPVKCRFVAGGVTEYYKGEIGIKLGVDLEWDASKLISFVVLSVGSDAPSGKRSLEGKYVGAKASVAAVFGLGAQALVGGSDDQIALQPLALEDSIGIGAAAGLGYLHLQKIRQ